MIRANPGVILLKDGVIAGKWHYRNLPNPIDNSNSLFSVSQKQLNSVKENWVIVFFIILLAFMMLLLSMLLSTKK